MIDKYVFQDFLLFSFYYVLYMSYRMYKTKAYVLRRRHHNESSMLISLYTQEFGHIVAHAQGIREPYSKLRASLQSFACISVELVRGKNIWRITNALLESYPWRPGDYRSDVSPLLSRMFLLLERLTPGEESHPEIFLACDSLYALSRNTHAIADNQELLEIAVVLRVLGHLGYVDAKKYQKYLWQDDAFHILPEIEKEKRGLISVINHGLRASHL
jgi:DNA repair protein RecO